MASRIVPTNIDGTFPVAGQDNPSQGFRDNFTNIKNNFTFARNEISDLQDKVILKSALAGSALDNDLSGTQLTNARLKAWTQSIVNLGAIDGDVTISFESGNFQKLTTAGPITLTLNPFPPQSAGAYGLIRVWIYVSNVSHTVTLSSSVSIGENDIAGFNPITKTITFDSVGDYVFDFSSIDSGANFLIFDIKRNRSTLRDPSLYFNTEVNPTFLVNYTQESFQTALGLEQGQDVISVRGSINSVALGNLSTADYVTQTYDDGVNSTQGMAGVSVTSSRGNIWTGTLDGVQNGDFVGYFNSYAYTGDNDGGNAFTVMSGINFFATGADVEAGLGGTIAIFTAPDGQGDLSNARMLQAVGIEHDQSVKFFGKAVVSEIDASDNTTTLALNEYVDFTNFSGEITINDFDNGYVYKFLVGSGNVWLLGTTNSNWTPSLVAPTSNFTLASWVKMETLSGKYRFTNLASSRDFSFYTVKTRNNV